jgi:citrate synthase
MAAPGQKASEIAPLRRFRGLERMCPMSDVKMAPKGLAGVVVEKTELSRVDGQKGELIYRGYNIDKLAQCSFEEVSHLFLYGALPNEDQLSSLDGRLKANREIPGTVLEFIKGSNPKDHPMATLRTAISMLSGFMDGVEDLSRDTQVERAIALLAKTATIAAGIARRRLDKDPVAPKSTLSHAANFLYMVNGEEPDEVVARTMDLALVLHADHSFNASTFTARVVASTQSDMVSAVTAAIGSLKGPLHGGANTAVMKMLQEIESVENVESWLESALAEKRKIMGFGHRVYKVFDPRAKHLKRMSEEWGKRVGNVKWFEMSDKLEKLMLDKKNINPNVDFYSASTYFAMGIDPEMYTPIFAVSRMLGWCSHVIEQQSDNRIFRPKANYVGDVGLPFKPLNER